MTAGDSIVVDTRSAAAPTAVTEVAAITTVGSVGGTITSAGHGLAVGDKITLNVDEAADDGTYEVVTQADANTITVAGAVALTADAAQVGATVSKYFVNDLSNNAGSTQTTKTLNAVSDADVTKPVLSLTVTCTQGTDAVLSNGTTLKATANATFGPQGVNGNVWTMAIVNSRGSLMPTVVVDDTAKTITVTGDMAYVSASDIQAVYAQGGGVAWAFATQTGTASSMIGSASATTASTLIKSSGGNAGDVVGTQSCALSVKSTEKLQAMAADDVTGVVAINGVATACTANPCTSAATTETGGWSSISFTEKFDAWTQPIADGTVTFTMTSTAIKDAKGNTVTTLALVD
jgi:hypothetical protein